MCMHKERKIKVKLNSFYGAFILINSLDINLFLHYEITLTVDVICSTVLWT